MHWYNLLKKMQQIYIFINLCELEMKKGASLKQTPTTMQNETKSTKGKEKKQYKTSQTMITFDDTAHSQLGRAKDNTRENNVTLAHGMSS